MKIKKVCEKCGSENVWVDAAADGTPIHSRGNWATTYYSHCGDCDAETYIINREIKETSA
jgi:hypothetical protein